MNRTIIPALLGLAFVFITSACTSGFKILDAPEEVVSEAQRIGTAAAQVESSAGRIETTATYIKEETKEPITKVKADVIIDETLILKETAEDLKLSESKLEDSAADLRSTIIGLEEDNANLKEESQQWFTRTLLSLSVLGTLGVAASAVLFFWRRDSRLAMVVGSSSVFTILLSATLIKFWSMIAWFGLGAIVVVLGVIAWQVWIRQTALSEVVQTADEMRDRLTPEATSELFIENETSALVNEIQSETTRKLVKKSLQILEANKKDSRLRVT